MQKGNIGVTTENIFPVIKKFLYSDHEIFLRELVSNAVDATQKLKTLASIGEFKGEAGDLTVHVSLGKDTITVSDHGIGLTAEEIDKYINQIAFSGANDFLEKYKNDANAIIGHFGLGFYSAFMVAKKVEIITKSYQDGAKAVKWTCDGSPEFTIEDTDKAERGTDIVLYIDDDCKEFLEEARISSLLKKYCSFLPIPVAFGKKKEWKDGKQVETAEDNIINDANPLWTLKPSELKDEDYKKFYRDLYPMSDEPLFWIHLNVDYPFHLTGILYFPKVKSNIELNKNKIQLYCNQVYVTDSVEGIVPDFLTLLHGVLDSPDIPLNVSRSYLQSDSNVKKISTYITKKVSDRLQSIFKNDRKQFEEKWNDLKIFINYGMLTQEDFYDRAKDFALLSDTDGKHYTFEEYKTLIKDSQTDKDGNMLGAEALIRWNHPNMGLIMPGAFIECFEDAGLIYRLDNYIWEEAAKQLKIWKDSGYNYYISVNISAKDFYHIDVYQTFKNLVSKYGIDTDKLHIEITETALSEDKQAAHKTIERLHDEGFIIEIDDFGSGYSSFNFLKDVCADVIKIDRVFLKKSSHEERGEQILRSIISLSHDIGMDVITEGVENVDQLSMLAKMNCDWFQGYYFSKPITVGDFEEKYGIKA